MADDIPQGPSSEHVAMGSDVRERPETIPATAMDDPGMEIDEESRDSDRDDSGDKRRRLDELRVEAGRPFTT